MVTQKEAIEMLELNNIRHVRVTKTIDKRYPDRVRTTYELTVVYSNDEWIPLSLDKEDNLDTVIDVIGRLKRAGNKGYELHTEVFCIKKERDTAEERGLKKLLEEHQ